MLSGTRSRRADEVGEEPPVAIPRVAPREVAGPLDHLEPSDSIRQRLDDLTRGGHRRDRVELAHANECRAVDEGELVENVETAHQVEAGRVQLSIDDHAGLLLVAGHPGPEQRPAARPLLV